MNLEVVTTALPGCYLIRAPVHADPRGTLVKTFRRDLLLDAGLCADFAEAFHSVSGRGVLRGLHYQSPPAAQVKIVSCATGEILDAAVDLRVGSPTYGHHQLFRLSGEKGESLYFAPGLAHGFLVLSDLAVITYLSSTLHRPDLDGGIHWASAGIRWPVCKPITSPRDAALIPLEELRSPFLYER